MGNFLARHERPLVKQLGFFKKIGFTFCIILIFSSTAYSQKYQVVEQGLVPENLDQMNKTQKAGSTIVDLFKKVEGTYQVQCFKKDYTILQSEALYQKIVSLRKEDQDVYIDLDVNSRLFLPSNASVKAIGFKKLETILYTSK
ncbi:hypothetical protein [Flavobacterium pedocola]